MTDEYTGAVLLPEGIVEFEVSWFVQQAVEGRLDYSFMIELQDEPTTFTLVPVNAVNGGIANAPEIGVAWHPE